MMPPLNARSSRGTTVLVFLNHSVKTLHMEAAKMTNSPATLQQYNVDEAVSVLLLMRCDSEQQRILACSRMPRLSVQQEVMLYC